MKRIILALVFLCSVGIAGTQFGPAYPFRLFSIIWTGDEFEVPTYSPYMHEFEAYLDYFQVGSYLEPYAVVEMTHGDGSVTYMGVDTNRLRFEAAPAPPLAAPSAAASPPRVFRGRTREELARAIAAQ